MGIGIDRLVAGLPALATDEARNRGIGTLELAAEVMTGLGAIALLLTAIAQAS